MRRKISSETWEQIRTGYAAGISVREIACEMDIPEGTLLSQAKAGREASEGDRKTTKDDQRVSFRPNESRDSQ